MSQRRIVVLPSSFAPIAAAMGVFLVSVVAACGGTPGASLPPSASAPADTTFDEFAAEACLAFAAMQRAVGNPDTGEGSPATEKLEAAFAAGDREAAAQAAAEIDAELQVGRRHAVAAARWQPASRMMTAFDRFLAAYQAKLAADLARGQLDPHDSQRVFEEAGGVAAWTEMLEAYNDEVLAARPSAAPPRECPGVPIGF